MNEHERAGTIDLSGTWAFSLGEQRGDIDVPGCWEAQGYDKYRDGPAVYRRTFHLPETWAGRPAALEFDAVSYHAEVAVDGEVIGEHRGLWSPFQVELPSGITPGEHELTVTVYKPGERFSMRESLAGFLPDVCTTFGGIWQGVRLTARGAPGFAGIHLKPELPGVLNLRVEIDAGAAGALALSIEVHGPDGALAATLQDDSPSLQQTYTLGIPGARPWSPGAPDLYTLIATLTQAGQTAATVTRRFGFRQLRADGGQLLFNDAPVCLRGLLHWGWYPDLVCPTPDADTIRAEFRRVRDMGYNMVKLCLWVPPPRYFDIADEEGVFLWLELPMWLPQVTGALREQAPAEYRDIMRRVHHHPSVVVYSLGCELGRAVDADLLARLDDVVRGQTCGALLCDNSGSGEAYGGLSFDFADFNDYHFYCDLHYFDPLVDHFRRDWRPARPWLFGEFCDSDDYRDPGEISAAHGGEMPWWWRHDNPIHQPIRLARRRQHEVEGVTGRTHRDLQRISRQESQVVRKTIVEKVRRRANMGGYVITGIRDTPLATSAVFDDLGRAKDDPAVSRVFNADTVLALDQGRLREWRHGGDRPRRQDLFNYAAGAPVSLRLVCAHAGEPLAGGVVNWQVTGAAGEVVAGGSRPFPGVAGGRPAALTDITFDAPAVSEAAALSLSAELHAPGAVVRNQWPLWVYPIPDTWPKDAALYDPAGCLARLDDLAGPTASLAEWPAGKPVRLLITSDAPPGLPDYVRDGGRVLILQGGAKPLPAEPCPFWRESIKLIEDHPVMDALPHAGFADLQFYSLATDYALEPGALPALLPGVERAAPLLTRLDARLFHVKHYLVEARLGEGRIIASTLRFQGGLGDQPNGLRDNPAGRFLLRRILDYLRE